MLLIASLFLQIQRTRSQTRRIKEFLEESEEEDDCYDPFDLETWEYIPINTLTASLDTSKVISCQPATSSSPKLMTTVHLLAERPDFVKLSEKIVASTLQPLPLRRKAHYTKVKTNLVRKTLRLLDKAFNLPSDDIFIDQFIAIYHAAKLLHLDPTNISLKSKLTSLLYFQD